MINSFKRLLTQKALWHNNHVRIRIKPLNYRYLPVLLSHIAQGSLEAMITHCQSRIDLQISFLSKTFKSRHIVHLIYYVLLITPHDIILHRIEICYPCACIGEASSRCFQDYFSLIPQCFFMYVIWEKYNNHAKMSCFVFND